MNVGPMMLVGILGTHFKIPLGTKNLVTLQNRQCGLFSCRKSKFQLVISTKQQVVFQKIGKGF